MHSRYLWSLEGGALAPLMSHEGKNIAQPTWVSKTSMYQAPSSVFIAISKDTAAEAFHSSAFLRAMAFIHNADIHHKDIRPDNFLVTLADKVTIIEFDCAILKPVN